MKRRNPPRRGSRRQASAAASSSQQRTLARVLAKLESARRGLRAGGDDLEQLRQLKVTLRHMRAALQLVSASRDLSNKLRALTDSASLLRNDEILRQLLELAPAPLPSRKLVEQWLDAREKARRQRIARARRLLVSSALDQLLAEARAQLERPLGRGIRVGVRLQQEQQRVRRRVELVSRELERLKRESEQPARDLIERLKQTRTESVEHSRKLVAALRAKLG